jgi:hypothetical protein
VTPYELMATFQIILLSLPSLSPKMTTVTSVRMEAANFDYSEGERNRLLQT